MNNLVGLEYFMSNSLVPVISSIIIGILGYIGYRYLKLRKKFGGKIPDDSRYDLFKI